MLLRIEGTLILLTVGMRELCYCENSSGRILFFWAGIYHGFSSGIEDFLYQQD